MKKSELKKLIRKTITEFIKPSRGTRNPCPTRHCHTQMDCYKGDHCIKQAGDYWGCCTPAE
tara:strand:- start:4274 stop:4456 length:183 start_codon:yes stop_codon:yes gene_type:complete